VALSINTKPAKDSKMACCVDETREMELKPFELCRLICAELSLQSYDDKPKDICALANKTLSREASPEDGASVKDEARAIRRVIRDLPPSFWGDEKVTSGSSAEALVTRLLLKPASAGGFCTGTACKRLPKNIDTKSIFSKGPVSIDGFSIMASPGQYTTLDHELSEMAKLFGDKAKSITFNTTVFSLISREQVTPGSSVITCKANKCNARLAALCTPKFLLIGFYNYNGSPEGEAKTLSLLEDLRLEASGKSTS
jgi:hypothetical protein